MSKIFNIKLTSAGVVNGVPVPAGRLVAVDERTARRLLEGGKGELATADDVEPAASAETVEGDASAEPTDPSVAKAKTKGGGK